MRAYFDSSAFVKRYVTETGSQEVLDRCRTADPVVLSALSLPEISSFLNRLVRNRQLAAADYVLFKQVIMKDLSGVEVRAISEGILMDSVHVLEECRIKTLDAIHIATARQARCDLFLTADRQQYDAAILMGLKSERVG